MATIEQQKLALLNALAGLIKESTGIPVFLYGQETNRPTGRYININVLSSQENGSAIADMYDDEGYYSSVVNHDIRITVTCYRSDAYSPLALIKQRIITNSNTYNKYFSGTAFGYLSSTQITRFDAPLDNVTFEERAYCTFDFNISYLDLETVSSDVIDTVEVDNTVYNGTPLDTNPIEFKTTINKP